MTPHPTLVLIAGGPGAGKTALGRELARHAQAAILLDKDVLGAAWVDAMLHHLNDGHIDRDSKVYWDIVRPLEYSALLATALDNLALGKTVIAVAPFGPELRDGNWMRRLMQSVTELGGRMRTIWIETDAETARVRMAARNDSRDAWKLAHWNEFSERAQFGSPREDLFVLRNTGFALFPDLLQQALNYLNSK
jgi:predicted kinase